jgi:DNA-directed RNA polymerase beta' subunit
MFDGDEMNIHIAQSIQAKNELKRIANVKFQIIGAKDSNPIIGCTQDALSGCYLLTKINYKISGRDAINFLCNTSSQTKFDIDKNKIYNGHEIFSHIIPEGINNIVNKNDKKILEINNGNLLMGILDKSTLSTVKNSIIHIIWDKYGPDKTRRFIDDAQRLALIFLNYRGFTFGIKDCINDNKKIEEQIKESIKNKILEYKVMLTQYENDTDQLNPEIIESNLASELNAFSADIGNTLFNSLNVSNNLFTCIESGSKGNSMNLQHIMGCIGQKSVEGKRIKKKVESRSLPIFHKDDDTPEARGFIKNSYYEGIQAYEYFYDAMGGREGLIDTAIRTAKTGYVQRQLIKGLEDLIIKYDNTNRNSNNTIIQYIYGENGIDQASQTELLIRLVGLNNIDIDNTYGLNKDQIKKIEKEHKIKNFDKFNKAYIDRIKKYRDNLRKIYAISNNNYKTLEEKYMLPVNLKRLTEDYSTNKVNLELNPEDIINDIEELLNSSETRLLAGLNDKNKILLNDDRHNKYLFEIALHDYLCPKKCIFEYGLSKKNFKNLINEIKLNFIKALVQPGEMIGIIAAQSLGEPMSQMSTTYSTKIKLMVKNKSNGRLKLYSKEIGKLCDKIINKNPELTYSTGHENSVETDLSTLNKEYYIIGVDTKEQTHWNKLSHISRHPVNGQIMKVKTKSGRIVETTLSHSHLIRRNQSVEPILGSELKVGMRIPVTKHIDDTFIKDEIIIDNNTYKLDHLFGWFIGAYLAEGLVNKYTIKITNISNHFIENIKLFAKRFNKDASVRQYKGEYGPGTDTTFSHKPLATLINDTCATGSFIKQVPDFAFYAPNEFKAGLIQGYFDGDGNFNNHGTRNNIRVCSRSEQLIKDIALLLNYFDIFAYIRTNMIKGSNMYEIDIPSKYAILYKTHIGTELHKDKLNDICTYLERDGVYSVREDIDKIEGLGKIIATCGKTLNLPGQSRNYGRWTEKESIGRRTLEKYINIFSSHENSNLIENELLILKQAANSNVVWDEIISIEIYTPEQSDYVYDFTVPGNQTFMIDTGIIIHNTLNTKHSAGVASKSTKNMGVSRIEELLHYSKDIKTPQMTIYFDDSISNNRSEVNKISSYLTHLNIKELLSSAEIIYDISSMYKDDNVGTPFFVNNQKAELSSLPFIFRLKLNMELMHDKDTTLLDIKSKFISHWTKNFTNLKNMKKIEKDIFSKISRCAILSNTVVDNPIIHIRFNMSSFNYNLLTEFLKIVLQQITLKGIDNIKSSDMINERKLSFDKETGENIVSKQYTVYTDGINFERIKYIKGLNHSLCTCNSIAKIYRLYGIEATRQSLINEFNETFNAGGSKKINHSHMAVLVDFMTHTGSITSIDRHGLSKVDSEPIAKASFEKTMDHFLNAAVFNEKDHIQSVSSRVMLGRVIPGGTGAFELMLDTDKLENSEYTQNENGGRITFAGLEEETLFKDIMKFGFSKNDFYLPV